MDADLREQMREMFQGGYFLEQTRANVEEISVDTTPSWLDEELRDALNEIPGPHERKKRTTVLRLAAAMASGVPIRNVFVSKDTCDRGNWYTRQSPVHKTGWNEIPEVANALELARRKAHGFYDDLEAEGLALRRRILFQTETRLAEISGAAAETLLDVMMDPDVASDVRRKAAVDTLTHAAPETAPKGQKDDTIHLTVGQDGPSMRDIRTRSRKLPGRVIDLEGEPEEEVVVEMMEGDTGPPPPPPGGLVVPKGLYEAPPTLTSDNGHGEEEEGDE